MRQGLTAEIEAADADPAARQRTPLPRFRRALPWLAVGTAAYLVTLIATFPARFVVDLGPRWVVSGTVWTGEAVVDGAYRVEWRWAPWRSLAAFAFAADVRVTGSGTDLAGSATEAPGRLVIEGLTGQGDGGLLAALGPHLPFVCDTSLQVAIDRMILSPTRSEARGRIGSERGSCTPVGGGTASPLPPLMTTLQPISDTVSAITVAEPGRDRVHLFEGQIGGGRIRLTPTRTGVATLPFARAVNVDEAL